MLASLTQGVNNTDLSLGLPESLGEFGACLGTLIKVLNADDVSEKNLPV